MALIFRSEWFPGMQSDFGFVLALGVVHEYVGLPFPARAVTKGRKYRIPFGKYLHVVQVNKHILSISCMTAHVWFIFILSETHVLRASVLLTKLLEVREGKGACLFWTEIWCLSTEILKCIKTAINFHIKNNFIHSIWIFNALIDFFAIKSNARIVKSIFFAYCTLYIILFNRIFLDI